MLLTQDIKKLKDVSNGQYRKSS